MLRLSLCALAFVLLALPPPIVEGAMIVNMFRPDDRCPGAEGTVNIAGCDTKDHLLRGSGKDKFGQEFELWCIDGSHFGLRFTKTDATGKLVVEKWVGLCPYEGGRNIAEVCKEDVAGGGFKWVSSFYRSRDTNVDDDGDGKEDIVRFNFDVDTCKLIGRHSNDGVVDNTVTWDNDPATADPAIPGDPSKTTDGPRDLLTRLRSEGALDPPGGGGFLLDDCPIPINQAPEPVPEPSTIVLTSVGSLLALSYARFRRKRLGERTG